MCGRKLPRTLNMLEIFNRITDVIKRAHATPTPISLMPAPKPRPTPECIEVISRAEAARMLNVLGDKNWVRWLEDDCRGRHRWTMVIHIHGDGRRVWYDPHNINAYIASQLKDASALGD